MDKALLHKLYIKENKSQQQIADILSCSNATISRYLTKYKVIKCSKHVKIDKQELYDLYITQEKSSYYIAHKLNYSQQSIFRYLRKYDIYIRNVKESKSKISLETRLKMAKSHLGKTTWNLGKKLSKEHKQKLSLGHIGKPASRLGTKVSLSTRRQISLALGGDGKLSGMNRGNIQIFPHYNKVTLRTFLGHFATESFRPPPNPG